MHAHMIALIGGVETRSRAEREVITNQVAALDRMLVTTREADQRALTLTQNLNREALALAAKGVDDRLAKMNEFRGALSDAQTNMMPRAEVKLVVDGLVARMENMQTSVVNLSQVMATLRAQLAGQDTGEDEARRSADRTRTVVFAIIGAGLAVISLYLGFRHPATTPTTPTTPTNTPAVTPTTAKP